MSDQSDTEFNELSWQSREVLKAAHQRDGTATTTQIREGSSLHDNRQITYRFKETSELDGLAEMRQLPSEDAGIAPKEISLTERGAEVAEQLLNSDDQNLSLEYLAAQIEHIREDLDGIEQRIGAAQGTENGGGNGADTDQLQEQISSLAMTVSEIESESLGGWSEQEQEKYELLWEGFGALTQYLTEQVDPDVDEPVAGYIPEELKSS